MISKLFAIFLLSTINGQYYRITDNSCVQGICTIYSYNFQRNISGLFLTGIERRPCFRLNCTNCFLKGEWNITYFLTSGILTRDIQYCKADAKNDLLNLFPNSVSTIYGIQCLNYSCTVPVYKTYNSILYVTELIKCNSQSCWNCHTSRFWQQNVTQSKIIERYIHFCNESKTIDVRLAFFNYSQDKELINERNDISCKYGQCQIFRYQLYFDGVSYSLRKGFQSTCQSLSCYNCIYKGEWTLMESNGHYFLQRNTSFCSMEPTRFINEVFPESYSTVTDIECQHYRCKKTFYQQPPSYQLKTYMEECQMSTICQNCRYVSSWNETNLIRIGFFLKRESYLCPEIEYINIADYFIVPGYNYLFFDRGNCQLRVSKPHPPNHYPIAPN